MSVEDDPRLDGALGDSPSLFDPPAPGACLAQVHGGECCGHPDQCVDEGYEQPDEGTRGEQPPEDRDATFGSHEAAIAATAAQEGDDAPPYLEDWEATVQAIEELLTEVVDLNKRIDDLENAAPVTLEGTVEWLDPAEPLTAGMHYMSGRELYGLGAPAQRLLQTASKAIADLEQNGAQAPGHPDVIVIVTTEQDAAQVYDRVRWALGREPREDA